MRLSRSLPVLLFLPAFALAACDPDDEAPPPATPANVAVAPAPPQAQPPAAPAPEGAPSAAGDDATYASGEVAIGEDTDAYDDDDPAALTDFGATLDPYGAWVDDPTYGTVWVPSAGTVGPDFVPYETAGHWVYDDDWVWVSDYAWGWAPFHYGRWVRVDGRGWAWIPGRVYRGAWVEWGVDDGYEYVGWYPMAPAFLWFGGVAVASSFYVAPAWVYCPRAYVFAPALAARVVARPRVAAVAVRVHPYVGASPMVHGPAPARLGFSAAEIPHATGAGAASLVRAQQFSRPSTATALGAHPPAPRIPVASAHPQPGVPYRGAPRHPAAAPSPGGRKPAPQDDYAPVPRRGSGEGRRVGGIHSVPGGSFHGSGGSSRGGGSHGGGGHR